VLESRHSDPYRHDCGDYCHVARVDPSPPVSSSIAGRIGTQDGRSDAVVVSSNGGVTSRRLDYERLLGERPLDRRPRRGAAEA